MLRYGAEHYGPGGPPSSCELVDVIASSFRTELDQMVQLPQLSVRRAPPVKQTLHKAAANAGMERGPCGYLFLIRLNGPSALEER